jgi:Family of unknown function (DUF6641)
MPNLKNLTLGTYATSMTDPILNRRQKMVVRLEQQKALANDPGHVETIYRWVKNSQGVKERVKLEKPVRRWWRIDPLGKMYLKLKYGARTLELGIGKDAIVVASMKELTDTLDLLIEVTKEGGLDNLLDPNKEGMFLLKDDVQSATKPKKRKMS